MGRIALDNVHLGRNGVIEAGDEIPESYLGPDGEQHDTDFARLEELGYVEAKGGRRPRGRNAEPVDEPQDEPQTD